MKQEASHFMDHLVFVRAGWWLYDPHPRFLFCVIIYKDTDDNTWSIEYTMPGQLETKVDGFATLEYAHAYCAKVFT